MDIKTTSTTILERVMSAVNDQHDMETDSIDRLIVMAYYIGREQSAKEISDKYNAHMAAQSARAATSRYHKMAASILDNGPGYIYSSDYSGDMTSTFGQDLTQL